MKAQIKTLSTIVLVFMGALLCRAQQTTIPDNELDQRSLAMPVDIKDQRTFVGLGKTTWWMVTVVLPTEHYSKDALERIFQYYSEKFPHKKDILRVSVFADEETYKRSLKPWRETGAKLNASEGELTKIPAKERWSIPHATYERLCYNEFYYYSPDPENPEKTERIILKGKSQTLTVIPDDCE